VIIGLIIISAIFGVIGGIVSNRLKSKFSKYAQMPTSSGLSGREVAQRMLDYYNIHDVQITQGQGRLTDHYNPKTKIVNLSPEVYGVRSVAAAAVAAHEVGHAVQHAESYAMLQFRSAIVPIVQLSSKIQSMLFMFGFAMIGAIGNETFLFVAIAAFAVTALFSIVTLPVEFDASNRALAWLENANITRGIEHDGAKDALKWAAMTYVVGALAAIAQLLYLVMLFLGSDD
jgi:Zn-dependent membrane protease YugP